MPASKKKAIKKKKARSPVKVTIRKKPHTGGTRTAKAGTATHHPPSPKNGVALKKNSGKQFSSTHQPPPEVKSLAARKRYALKGILDISTGMKLDPQGAEFRKLAADYFQVEELDVTIRMIMEFRQIQKAIQKADTQAFTAVMDRAYGKPKQQGEEKQGVKITINGNAVTSTKK